jgi:hypothetical protein
MADTNSVAGYDAARASRGSPDRSGTGVPGDVTSLPGQMPGEDDHGIFGGPLPTTTGAPGTAGGGYGGTDTSLPGQLGDSFTGLSEDDITDTGAPGSEGAGVRDGAGSDAVSFTRAGSYLDGTYASQTVRNTIDGPGSSTEANPDGYATGGPQLPGIRGNEPEAGSSRYQPGGGRVMRGGRAVRG